MMKKLFSILLLLGMTLTLFAQNISIIPQPLSIKTRPGNFVLQKNIKLIIADPSLQNEANYFNQFLKNTYGFELKVYTQNDGLGDYLLLQKVNGSQSPESYSLAVEEHYIHIIAPGNAGVFYGIQSLMQLMPAEKTRKIKLPFCILEDEPRYAWRGMHLDCSRHFFEAEFVKKYIDQLATYKMNVFHWHLTDDQGWRIEIKQYPKLTQVGAYRKGSMVGHYKDHKYDSIPYGGFYTQEQIKDIVAYAAARHVTIVPEIEMPGHALAALAAYPEFSCTTAPKEVGMTWGVEQEVFCPTPETFTFLNNILLEVMDLFPSRYIHIGGDEVLKDVWNNSEYCKQLMTKENLKDAHELQSYFIRRIETFVNAHGRSIIGWDEILEGGLAPNAAVMSWRGTEGGVAAAKQKHKVVMTPGAYCYFDHYQGTPESEPLAIGGFTTLEKVYSYEPTPDTLTSDEAQYIMGAQANVWTEYINTPEQVEYMAMPRMLALAEVVWSAKRNKNYESFMRRLNVQRKWLDKRKLNYSKTAFK